MKALPGSESIRYLSAWLNLDLSWEVQIARMDKTVRGVAHSICDHHLDLIMSASAVKQYLLPCLKIGLEIADIGEATLSQWDNIIRKAVCRGANMTMGHGYGSLNPGAFYLATGIPKLADHRWAIRIEELIIRLNASFPSSKTGWARLGESLEGSGAKSSRTLKGNRTLRTCGEAFKRFKVKITRRID